MEGSFFVCLFVFVLWRLYGRLVLHSDKFCVYSVYFRCLFLFIQVVVVVACTSIYSGCCCCCCLYQYLFRLFSELFIYVYKVCCFNCLFVCIQFVVLIVYLLFFSLLFQLFVCTYSFFYLNCLFLWVELICFVIFLFAFVCVFLF